jgi:hypothetical protein
LSLATIAVARCRRNHTEQKRALYALVDPVSPPPQPDLRVGLRWRRRVLPPGPKGLLRRPFIAIAGLRQPPQYRRGRRANKGPAGTPHRDATCQPWERLLDPRATAPPERRVPGNRAEARTSRPSSARPKVRSPSGPFGRSRPARRPRGARQTKSCNGRPPDHVPTQ